MKAAVLYDSSAYLKTPLKERSNLFKVDFTLVLPSEEIIVESTDESHLKNFFDEWIKENVSQPKTAQPNIQDYHNAFKKIIAEGYDTVFGVYLSSSVSGTFQTAESVSNQYRDKLNIVNFDAVGLSVNMEQLVKQITLMIDRKYSFDEIQKNAEWLNSESRFFIALEENDNLIKGGRGQALNEDRDSALKTRPVLEYVPGNTPVLRESFRTNKRRNEKLANIAADYQLQYPDQEILVSIGHTLDKDKARKLKDTVQSTLENQHIDISIIGTAFCSHLGQGALSFGLMPTVKGVKLDD